MLHHGIDARKQRIRRGSVKTSNPTNGRDCVRTQKMPRPCAVEFHARGYKIRQEDSLRMPRHKAVASNFEFSHSLFRWWDLGSSRWFIQSREDLKHPPTAPVGGILDFLCTAEGTRT